MSDDDRRDETAINKAEAALAALLGISVDELRDPARSGPAMADALTDAGAWLKDAILGDKEARRSADARWEALRTRLADAGLDIDDAPDDLAARLRAAAPTREAVDALRRGARRSEQAAIDLTTWGMRAGEWLKAGADRLRDWADQMAEAERARRPDLRVVPGGAGAPDVAPEQDAPAETMDDDPKAGPDGDDPFDGPRGGG